uniref:Uncharacterized protein n=1 Tax=Vespula pensylvanica TaxID=30213 RepID=A0A834UGW2_VESPE|nr:hypothetical protein H0235_000979 [Vespula pensylvanica]
MFASILNSYVKILLLKEVRCVKDGYIDKYEDLILLSEFHCILLLPVDLTTDKRLSLSAFRQSFQRNIVNDDVQQNIDLGRSRTQRKYNGSVTELRLNGNV